MVAWRMQNAENRGLARILVGPTASGKSGLAQWLAERHGWVVLSADSMLVYRGMEVGTAKPTAVERKRVRYFGVDVVGPDEAFSTGDFLREAARAWQYCEEHGLELLVVGGTGLYARALLNGLDGPMANPERRAFWEARLAEDGLGALQHELREQWPEVWGRLSDPDNPRRCVRALEVAEAGGGVGERVVRERQCVAGLWRDPEVLKLRIEQRARAMLDGGLLAETDLLRSQYREFSATAAHAIGYAEARAVLDGELTRRDALERICVRTRQLAKRQRTWFRHQIEVDWVTVEESSPVEWVAEQVLERWRLHGASKIILPGT